MLGEAGGLLRSQNLALGLGSRGNVAESDRRAVYRVFWASRTNRPRDEWLTAHGPRSSVLSCDSGAPVDFSLESGRPLGASRGSWDFGSGVGVRWSCGCRCGFAEAPRGVRTHAERSRGVRATAHEDPRRVSEASTYPGRAGPNVRQDGARNTQLSWTAESETTAWLSTRCSRTPAARSTGHKARGLGHRLGH